MRAQFELRVDRCAAVVVELWIFTLEILRQHPEFILRLLQRRARFQARLNIQFAIVAVFEKILLAVSRKHPRHR